MRAKEWYTISLVQYGVNEQGESIRTFTETIAKVRSKGLACIVYECLKLHYLPTTYTVIVE